MNKNSYAFVKSLPLSIIQRSKFNHGHCSILLQHMRKERKFPLMAWMSFISTIYLVANRTEAECDSNKNFSIQELAAKLKEELKVARQRLEAEGKHVPTISARAITFPGNFGKDTDTHILDIKFSPDCNISGLVSSWLEIFGDTAEANRLNLDKLKQFYADGDRSSLPLISKDKAKSMTIAKYKSNNKINISVSIFKDNGFTTQDLKHIRTGYERAFCQKQFPKLQFQWNDESMQQFDGLKDNLKRLFEFKADGENDGPPSFNPKMIFESVDGSDNFPHVQGGGDAKSKLQSLGVEVFDSAKSPRLDWSCLAGYTTVKQHIEDTVINSLKYPDLYDKIAQNTRVIYETNRPKAILLEGPPGTGKTLTARILASQCNTTLVVLKLESIVSKWYGDSEKKLSKILDACDELDNTIIFVDEVDALAQSRDSEQGIHEVSKRVLSILLQRLEGFQGKSKSILICATNRKQDLDPALLSRFDLIIPFPLPDSATRIEIFKRYAKQFSNVKVYNEFANLSDGFSCRDIKESCEQAERRCASRIAKSIDLKDQNPFEGISDDKYLPTVDDYKECIEAKSQEFNSKRIQVV